MQNSMYVYRHIKPLLSISMCSHPAHPDPALIVSAFDRERHKFRGHRLYIETERKKTTVLIPRYFCTRAQKTQTTILLTTTHDTARTWKINPALPQLEQACSSVTHTAAAPGHPAGSLTITPAPPSKYHLTYCSAPVTPGLD